MAAIKIFEDPAVWKKAGTLSKKIYQLTFIQPLSNDFRLRDQMRGSAGSIMDNIAAGFGKGSRFEFINSSGISEGETSELKSPLFTIIYNSNF